MRAGTKSFMVLAAAVFAVCCAVAAGRWLSAAGAGRMARW